jgi:hypothetical protein
MNKWNVFTLIVMGTFSLVLFVNVVYYRVHYRNRRHRPGFLAYLFDGWRVPPRLR